MSHLGRAQRHQFSLNTQGKKYSSFICDYLFLKQVKQSRGLEDRPAELYCRLQVSPTRMDPSSCDHGASTLGWTGLDSAMLCQIPTTRCSGMDRLHHL